MIIRQKHVLGVFIIIDNLQKDSTYIFTHFLHRFSFLEVKKRTLLRCFPTVCFTWSACCVCDKYLSYDASNLLQKHIKTVLGVFCARGALEMSCFLWQIIGNKTGVTGNWIQSFCTLPCISSLMVRVTFSPPSDWTLMGSMSGLDVKVGAWFT